MYLRMIMSLLVLCSTVGANEDVLIEYCPDGVQFGMEYDLFKERRLNAIPLTAFKKEIKDLETDFSLLERFTRGDYFQVAIYYFNERQLSAIVLFSESTEKCASIVTKCNGEFASNPIDKEIHLVNKGQSVKGFSKVWENEIFKAAVLFSEEGLNDSLRLVIFQKGKADEAKLIPQL